MACDALSAARAAKRGIRLSITVRNAADLSAWHVVLTETTRIVLPGFDINTTLNAGSSTLQHLLEKVYAAISPSLSQIAVGAEMLQKFRQQYMFEGVAKGSSVESGVSSTGYIPPYAFHPFFFDCLLLWTFFL